MALTKSLEFVRARAEGTSTAVVEQEGRDSGREQFFNDLRLLAGVMVQTGPTFLNQILGRPLDFGRAYLPKNDYLRSEYRMRPFHPGERGILWGAEFVTRMWTPKTPWTGTGLLERRPAEVFHPCRDEWGPTACTDPNERWFFINGIVTDEGVGKDNRLRLSEVFGRPVTMLSNPTDGLFQDVGESIKGRTLDEPSGPAVFYATVLRHALTVHERVVLLSHSQGGIVTANIVEQLLAWETPLALLQKLELYMFASAADRIPAHPEDSTVPFVEHYFNEHDVIAKLGANSRKGLRGEKFLRKGQWGHLLNHHYLDRFGEPDSPYQRKGGGTGTGRLHGYVGGKAPGSLPDTCG